MQWTEFDVDVLLEVVLPCTNELEYQRALVKYSKEYGRGAVLGLKEGDRLLRRRAIRRTDYTGPAYSNSRSNRSGLDWSWVEHRILHWAFVADDPERQEPVSVSYMARMLQREESEVNRMIERKLTHRHGVKGFDV